MKHFFSFTLTFALLIIISLLTNGEQISADNGKKQISSPLNIPETPALNLLGQIGGTTGAVTVQGNYAYLGVGPRVIILNVSNPANPLIIGQSEVFSGVVTDIEARNNSIYVASGDGFRILDVTNPSAPTTVGYFATVGSVLDVILKDQYAFIAYNGIRVINIANSTNPVQAGIVTGISANAFAVSGQFLYVASGSSGLKIYNITNPATPVYLSSIDTPGFAGRVVTVGNYAYVADSQGGIRFIDISNSNQPVEVGHYQVSGRFFNDVTVVDNKAYIAGGLYYGLRIVDVSNLSNPFELGFSLSYGGLARRVFVSGNYAYMAQDRALEILNVITPSNPQTVWDYDIPSVLTDVDAQGTYVFTAAHSEGLISVDVANPAVPLILDEIANGWFADNIFVLGNLAYLTSDPELYIVNITNPANLVLTGSYSPGTDLYVYDVFVQNNIAYVTLYDGEGLRILNVTNPAAPIEIGSYVSPDNPYVTAVAVSGNYAYMAESTGYLRILNVSNPAAPVQVGLYNTQSTFLKELAVRDSYIYLVSYHQDMQIVNVSNPASPMLVGTFYDEVLDVGVSGDYTFLATNTGLRIIDATDPTRLGNVAFFPMQGIDKLDISGNKLYLTGSGGGLLALDFFLTSTGLIPTSGGSLTSVGDQTSYQFPAGTFSNSVTVTHTVRSDQSVIQPNGLASIGHVFDVNAVYSNGQPAQPIPGHTYSLVVTYGDAELMGIDETTLALYYWNGSQWIAEPTSAVNTATNEVIATPDHLSTWAIWGATPERIWMPITRHD